MDVILNASSGKLSDIAECRSLHSRKCDGLPSHFLDELISLSLGVISWKPYVCDEQMALVVSDVLRAKILNCPHEQAGNDEDQRAHRNLADDQASAHPTAFVVTRWRAR